MSASSLSPREELAVLLGGEVIGRDAIRVGERVVFCSPFGVVRVGGTSLGSWSDGAEVLAAAYRIAVAA